MRTLVLAALTTVLAAVPAVGATPATAAPVAPAAAEGSTFTPVSPVRVLDTRDGTGGTSGPVGAGGTATLNLASRVPATATAVVLNVTAVAPTSATYVTVFPHGQARPLASNLNVVAADIRPNLVTVALGTGLSVDLYNNAGSVHLIADLAGYYAPGAGSRYVAERPHRKLDTRQEGGPLGPGGTRVLDLTGSVPASATAVTFNLTATDATAPTHVTAWPAGTTRPAASNLNLRAGETRPNLVTVALGADRRVSLYNNAGQVNLIVDLAGFYTPEFGATFLPVSPSRVLDTRTGTSGPIDAGESITVDPGAPLTATAVLLNVTGVDATTPTWLSVSTDDGFGAPNPSNLNLSAGETAANLAAVGLGTTDPVTAYNFRGSVHLVADLAGVFVVPAATCTVDCAYTWGGNQRWELGTGQRVRSSSSAAPVVELSGVADLTSGTWTRYALRTDGTVLAWGDNFNGQLGGGWYGDWSAVPGRVSGLTGVTDLAAGHYNAFALLNDGTVRAWGMMFEGGLGNGTSISNVPVPVTGLTGVTAVASSAHTGYALRTDGTVWAWGSNEFGALGDSSTVDGVDSPVQVTGLTGVTAITAGWQTAYALRADGTVWGWGRGDAGGLGAGFECEGDGCHPAVPLQVAGLTEITALAGGNSTAYALRADGTVWSWGGGAYGQLGNGTSPQFSETPVRVTGLTDITALAGGSVVGYALRADGTVWAWGANDQGQLGNGVTCPSPPGCHSAVPVQVAGLAGVTAIAPGGAVVPNP